jgi:hypothetical protein
MKSTNYTVFGWLFTKSVLVDGEELPVIFPRDTPMDISANWVFWTKGAREITTYPESLNDVFVTQQRGKFLSKNTFAGRTYKKGNYIFKAVGDTEYWCLDYLINGKDAPDLEFVLLAAGQTYASSVGQLILIASGQTNLGAAPTPLEIASENAGITATTDASLIIFSRSK